MVDNMYGAFLENEWTKDWHVPSKESMRAKVMPTCIILKYLMKFKDKIKYRGVLNIGVCGTEIPAQKTDPYI